MRWIKFVLVVLFVFTLVFTIGKGTILATGYTDAQLEAQNETWIGDDYTANQNWAGYYIGNDGLNYPIGDPVNPNS